MPRAGGPPATREASEACSFLPWTACCNSRRRSAHAGPIEGTTPSSRLQHSSAPRSGTVPPYPAHVLPARCRDSPCGPLGGSHVPTARACGSQYHVTARGRRLQHLGCSGDLTHRASTSERVPCGPTRCCRWWLWTWGTAVRSRPRRTTRSTWTRESDGPRRAWCRRGSCYRETDCCERRMRTPRGRGCGTMWLGRAATLTTVGTGIHIFIRRHCGGAVLQQIVSDRAQPWPANYARDGVRRDEARNMWEELTSGRAIWDNFFFFFFGSVDEYENEVADMLRGVVVAPGQPTITGANDADMATLADQLRIRSP